MSDTTYSEFIRGIENGQIVNYAQVATICLFLYDYVINFNQEHHVVWSCRVTGGVAVFVALRYATLAYVVTSVVNAAITSCEGAYIVEIIYISTQCATYFAQAAFAAIRVYAIQRGRWPLSVVVMALGLVPVATNIYAVSQVKLVDAFQYCLLDSAISINNQHIFLIATRVCVLAFNLLVLVATWQATRVIRYATSTLNNHSSLATLLMRDGSVHFGIISALNAANIVTNLLEGVHQQVDIILIS